MEEDIVIKSVDTGYRLVVTAELRPDITFNVADLCRGGKSEIDGSSQG